MSVTTLHAAEKPPSLEAEFKGMAKYFLAIWESKSFFQESAIIFAWVSQPFRMSLFEESGREDLCKCRTHINF